MSKTVSIFSLPRAAALAVLALLFAVAGPTPALAERCQYSSGATDLGPCVQFQNDSSGGNFDLWCKQGPTPSSQKIIMRDGDSFTCKVENGNAEVATTNLDNNWRSWGYSCSGSKKRTVILLSYDAVWTGSCIDLE